jgi:H/ACA ribonucleoprotein complex non-core subunit NAF1
MRDQELSATDEAIFSRNAYDEHGPYDIDYAAPGPGPSSSRVATRPAPIPYDDPYGDDYTAPDAVDREMSAPSRVVEGGPSRGYERAAEGRGRGRDGPRGRGGGGGRGRDRDRDRGGHRDSRDRGRGRGGGRGGGGGGRGPPSNQYGAAERPTDGYNQQDTRPMSPTSLAIARATGQSSHYDPQPSQGQRQQYQPGYASMYPDNSAGAWGFGQQYQQYGYNIQHQPQHGFIPAAPFVQPHINPRFASAFGLGMPGQPQSAGVQSYRPAQSQQQQQIPGMRYTPSETQSVSVGNVGADGGGGAVYPVTPVQSNSSWTDEWAVPIQARSSSASENTTHPASGPAAEGA